jgi:Flp pilus assembly protein TadB
MSLGKNAVEFCCRFPKIIRLSSASEKRAAKNLDAAGLGEISARDYLSGAFTLSIAIAAAALMPLAIVLDVMAAAGVALILLSASIGIALALPNILAKRRQALIEAELPFFIREIAAYIDVGLPFEKAVSRMAKAGYILSPEFSRFTNELSTGKSMQQALSNLSSRTASLPLKRALLLLSTIYETGSKTEPLKRLSEELSESQVLQMRAESGRFSLFTIAFIAASALVPSFFMVYATLSPALLQQQVSSLEIFAAFLLIFPAINAMIVCTMALFLPPAEQESGNEWNGAVKLAKRMGADDLRSALFLLALLSFFAACASFTMGTVELALLLLCIAPATYVMLVYFASREISVAEGYLPDALYSAAATHRIFSSERMLSFLAKGDFGLLSEAFYAALQRQKAGEGFEQSLAAAQKIVPSRLVGRAFSLLIVAHQTGADMYFAMRESASDVVAFFSLVRERAALLSIQKYTILAASSLLVPAIIGTVSQLSGSLAPASSLIGGNAIAQPSLALACQIYLISNAALSSLLLAMLDGNRNKAAIYFLIAAPLSELVFSLASSGVVPPT